MADWCRSLSRSSVGNVRKSIIAAASCKVAGTPSLPGAADSGGPATPRRLHTRITRCAHTTTNGRLTSHLAKGLFKHYHIQWRPAYRWRGNMRTRLMVLIPLVLPLHPAFGQSFNVAVGP